MTAAWPTPIMRSQMPDTDLVDRFVQYLMNNVDLQNPPSDSANFDVIRDGGGVCQDFKTQIIDPAFDSYIRNISNETLDDFKNYKYKTWIKSVGPGSMIGYHNHHISIVSGVFYLLCDNQSGGGELEMLDPRVNAGRGFNGHFPKMFKPEIVLPKTRDILMFPSFMYHYTSQFMGAIRLALTVDLYHKSLEGTGVNT